MSVKDWMFIGYISLSLIILMFISIKTYFDKKSFSYSVKNLLVAAALIMMVLIFPQYHSKYPAITSLVFSLLYAVKSLGFGQAWEVCRWIVPDNNIVYFLYYFLTYSNFIIVPIFTVSFLISIFGNVSDKIRLLLLCRKNIYVFSCLNEGSLSLAKSLNLTTKSQIIFCDYDLRKLSKDSNDVNQAREIKAIITEKKSTDLHIKKFVDNIVFYEISSEHDQNLQNTLKLIDKYKCFNAYNKNVISTNKKNAGKQRVKINLFASGRVYETIIDSTDKGAVQVKLIDEIKFSCYRLLNRYPLYDYFCVDEEGKKSISVLIVGGGYTGMEMLKSIVWCGESNDFSLLINVIDKSSEIKSRFQMECPELTKENGYNINFITCDVETIEFKNALNQYCSNTTYCVVCMAEDNLNMKTAMYLREHFLRKSPSRINDCLLPIINVRIRNSLKSNTITNLEFKNKNYHLIEFGTISETFDASSIENKILDRLAQLIHLAYSLAGGKTVLDISKEEESQKLETYFSSSYSQRSSLATALHIKYKLYEIGYGDFSFENFNLEQINQLRKMITKDMIDNHLAPLEHQRWNAYMRSEGYCLCTKEDVACYIIASEGNHVFHIGKQHPALVPWDDLDDAYNKVKEVTGLNCDFKVYDKLICEQIPNIFEKIYMERF